MDSEAGPGCDTQGDCTADILSLLTQESQDTVVCRGAVATATALDHDLELSIVQHVVVARAANRGDGSLCGAGRRWILE